MKLCSKLERVLNYFFITLIILMIILIGCSVPGSTGSGGSSNSSKGSKETEEITMSGSFSIKVDPNEKTDSSLFNKNLSIETKIYTVIALDITVTYVPTSSVVDTFNWTPPDPPEVKVYSVDINQYGEYEVKVVQTAVNDIDPGDILTTEDNTIVDIQPMKVTVVTIVPGASLYIVVDDGGSSPTYAVFPEDFDSTALDQVPAGWSSNGVPDTYVGVVNNGSAHSLPNFLRLHDENDTKDASAYASIADSTYGQLTFYFQVPDTPTPTTNSYCKILDISHDWLIDVCFNDSEKIEVRKPDGEKIPLMEYDFNTWYKIEVKWDKSAGSFKILINDNDYGNYQINNPSQTISYIQFHAGTGDEPDTTAILYIDDIDLNTNVEPIISQAFTENFDSTAINDIPEGFYFQHIDTDTFAGVVDSEITVYSSTNCLKISDENDPGYLVFKRDIEDQPYGQLTFYLYFDESSLWAGLGIGNIATLFFDKTPDNNISITLPDSTIVSIGNFTTNTWNKVTVKWDSFTFNYQVLFNDANLGVYQYQNEDVPSAFAFMTQGPAGQLYYLDDITLTLNPEFIE